MCEWKSWLQQVAIGYGDQSIALSNSLIEFENFPNPKFMYKYLHIRLLNEQALIYAVLTPCRSRDLFFVAVIVTLIVIVSVIVIVMN